MNTPFLAVVRKGVLYLFEDEIDGKDETDKGCYMVPMHVLPLKQQIGNHAEDHQRDDFLNHFELHQGVGPAVPLKADAIGWHLQTVFDKGNGP